MGLARRQSRVKDGMAKPISFTGNPLDRAGMCRSDAAWLAARKAEPGARILPLWRLKPLVLEGPCCGFLPPGGWQSLVAPDREPVFLGLHAHGPRFALDISAAEESLLAKAFPGGSFMEMRPAAMVLPDADTVMAGQAKVLVDWHARHRFCANCGMATEMRDGGWRRACPACGAEHFPRTDPVVIMLPVRGDACLVGRNARFTGGLYSAFAGFIEPGETIEEAVARELIEEVNLPVGRITYYASQPWPFPSSLMIGCFAEALTADFRIDENEIADARWMTKADVRARLDGAIDDGIKLPVPIAIAHHLLKTWAEW